MSELQPKTAPKTPRTGAEVRQAFQDFFAAEGHKVLPSGSLVPRNDPTLMFVNAGMVPFKDIFTGRAERPAARATTSQKCIRISGKHNDLENVGVTARHHTFFEMLGNFSFGDYFKERAIDLAWRFITEVLQLPEERLVVTIFGGEGELAADEEAGELWQRVARVPAERILRCGMADNFWQMGEVGPCGPCSEIHYYFGEGEPDIARFGEEPGVDGSGWVELWNLVFMQFERNARGEFTPLPHPSIDTGAGLERLAAVVQGVTSNYDTDLLRPIVERAAELAGLHYEASQSEADVSLRVIADHARTAAFLIAEGIFPDRDGRAYVLRRVMRRAIRHAHLLGLKQGFLAACAEVVITNQGAAFPELHEHAALIKDVINQEEARFRETLARGLELIQANTDWLEPSPGQRCLPGAVAFKLYDTYGFPLDLQQVIGREQGFAVDDAGFEAALATARDRSRGSKVGSAALDEGVEQLERRCEATTFVGYDQLEAEAKVVALLDAEARPVTELRASQTGFVAVDTTPFYAEAGGQAGDMGEMHHAGFKAQVLDTQRPKQKVSLHRVVAEKGGLTVGDAVTLSVDASRRQAIRRHHSATHLLHHALREALGPQATQKGSYVGPDRLRFDYAGSQPLSRAQLDAIEAQVNQAVLANVPVTTELCDMAGAKAKGAIGLFEERYGEEVRVLTMGASIELCGGTHVARSGDIGAVRVLSDVGVAAGVRRIEAVAGEAALAHAREQEAALETLALQLKTTPDRLQERVAKLLEELKAQGRELEQAKRAVLEGSSASAATVKQLGEVTLHVQEVPATDMKTLRDRVDQLKDAHAPAVVLLGSASADGKALLAFGVSKALSAQLSAKTLIASAAPHIRGGGGGRPDFAQAGGAYPEGLAQALEAATAAASDQLAP